MGGGSRNSFQANQETSCRSNHADVSRSHKDLPCLSCHEQQICNGHSLGARWQVILTFSRKFNNAQLKYGVTDQELLAILEACKNFKQIIHGCNIIVHTNHKNLTFSTAQASNACVERSLIRLQNEFGVKIEHIPREENVATDGLSILAFDKNLFGNNTTFATQTIDEEYSHMLPVDMCHIEQKQLTDKPLQ
jgi:hypothetical protein